MNTLKNKINCELLKLSVSPKLRGYIYLREAIEIIVQHRYSCPVLKKDVYPIIANSHNMKINSVEKNIYNAIECAFLHGDINTINNEFGNLINDASGKITLKALIMHIASKLK